MMMSFTAVSKKPLIVILVLMLSAIVCSELGLVRHEIPLTGPFVSEHGLAYIAIDPVKIPLSPILYSPSDGMGFQSRGSDLSLYVGGKRLTENHSLHDDIRKSGNGKYSHWGRALYFSLPGNIEPNASDLELSVRYPVYVRDGLLLTVGLLLWLSILVNNKKHEGFRSVYFSLSMSYEKIYWISAATILLAGIFLRWYWTFSLEYPYTTPDSDSYFNPALEHPLFPLATTRTAGYPYLLSVALHLFKHPVGILIVQNLLWLFSTCFIAAVFKNTLRSRTGSLLIMLYLSFCMKNLDFEYQVMTEHLSRVLYLVTFAYLVWRHGKGNIIRHALILSLLTAANILVKPSAVILIPVIALYYVSVFISKEKGFKTILYTSGVYAAASMILVCLYMGMFYQRFGTFSLTNYTGHYLFYHTGHLTYLDGGKFPQLKQDLKPVLGVYLDEFVSKGRHFPNWLVFGSIEGNEELTSHFGDVYPRKIVYDHVRNNMLHETGREPEWHVLNRNVDIVLKELAVEGIMHNAGEYLKYAFNRTLHLFSGYGHYYYNIQVTVGDAARNREDMREIWEYEEGRGYESSLLDSLITKINDDDGADRAINNPIGEWLADVCVRIGISAFVMIHYLLWMSLVLLLPLNWRLLRTYISGLVLLSFSIVVAYSLFLGFINSGEPSRFIVNVQDLIIIGYIMIILLGMRGIKRLLILASLRLHKAPSYDRVNDPAPA